MPKHKAWWGAPKNFSDRTHERKIGWLELFYDLVYVAAIGQLTHNVAEHPSFHTVAFSFLLFSLVFWSWVNGSQYYDLHGNEGLRTRLLTFWQMLAMAAVSITISDAFEGNHKPFAITFMMVQLMITYLWLSVDYYDKSHRKYSIFYTTHYSISFILLFISVFTTADTATILWIIVFILNATPPLTVARRVVRELKKQGQVFSASAAIVERFGLLTIIIMTESILSTVNGIAEFKDKQPEMWFAFILGILISFLLWSIYFDMTSEQETKSGYKYLQLLIFIHFPLLASLSVIGASIKVLLMNIENELPDVIQWMFCIALCILLCSVAGLTRIMKEEEEDRSYIKPVSIVLVLCSVCVLLIPIVGNGLHTLAFMGLISFILIVPIVIGIRAWIKFKYEKNTA